MIRMALDEAPPAELARIIEQKSASIKDRTKTVFDHTSNDYTDEEKERRGAEFLPTVMIDIDRRREENENNQDQ